MFRNYVINVYIKLLEFSKFINYFKIPNLQTKVSVEFSEKPKFQQKTFLTGIGKVKIGTNCTFGYKLGGFNYGGSIELQPRTNNALIEIGNYVNTNNNIFISSCNKIVIGNNTLIGQNVCIMDFEAHGIQKEKRKDVGEIGEVIIGDNVWIGNNVTILKDSNIGDNTIVAAGAVVKGFFPPNVIIGGVPAKLIKAL